ncbi:MAG: helix-turn-helix domain-containing protein [Treponema sp.]|jgi:AraC-like DNA-binding protein/ligand-binding sensor protein|nr:helix-turn-helix domain-containing protein [Treponema sp.]
MKEIKTPESGTASRKRPLESERPETAAPKYHEPENSFFSKARKMMPVYTQSTGSKVCVYDHNFLPVSNDAENCAIEQNICQYCRNGGCREMHTSAIKEASRRGGSHIYQCELGLLFWTSPIYTEGRFSGALRGTGFLHETADAAGAGAMYGGGITPEEFAERAAAIPKADAEKGVSLAEMLLLCAEALSTGSEGYHEILRRRSEQQRILLELTEKLKTQYPEGSTPPAYPLDKERRLIAAMRQGDNREAITILHELLAALIFSNPNHFKYIQLRALELAVLLSRVGAGSGSGGYAAMENNTRCLRRIQDSKTIEELTDILHNIVANIAEQVASFQGIPHAAALRKAERFIRENFTRKISLREISEVSGLSAPYFSTIFKEEMGENLSKYLNRLRVEKASRLLLETDFSLSEIASACCFEDQSWFSKIFKTYTGLSPGKYRSQGGGIVREISEDNLSEDYLKTVK